MVSVPGYPAKLLRKMLEIYSPSGSEAELAEFLHGEMKSNGFAARIDDVGNVVGVLGNEGPRILLCGHMDTVPGRVPIRQDVDLLYGRGAVDAKSSLAAMIVGAALAKERSSHPFQVTVAAVVEEETSSKGIRAITDDQTQYAMAGFGEPSGVSNLIIGSKGSLKLHASITTNGRHSASLLLSASSYEEASVFWRVFEKGILRNSSPSKFEAVTGCVTRAEAGDLGNSVPTLATLDVDLRIPPGLSSNDLITKIKEFTTRYSADRPGVRIQLDFGDQAEAFLGSPNSTAVSAFRWAIRKMKGGQVAMVKKTGTSDMNLFAQRQNIPMFAYGPGDSRFDRAELEHVRISEYLACIEVYATALPRFAENASSIPPLPAATP
ncbi:MAG: M20/M25/M40 family metallo-hydrolase [Candidatus Bathyarchaeia archaeon]